MPKRGCSYERVKGRCISKRAYERRQSPKKGCSYGRKKTGKVQKSGKRRCYSRKEFDARMKRASKRIGSKGGRLQGKLSLVHGLKKWKRDAVDW